MKRPVRPVSPGDALLAADPAAQRHLRRAARLALPGALLVVVQAFALARLVVELAQQGRFDAAAGAVLIAAAAARGALSWSLERSGRQAAAEAIGRLRGRLVEQAATLAAASPGALRPGELATDAVHALPSIEAYLGRFLSGRPAAAATTVVVLLAVAGTDLLSAIVLAPTVPILIVFLWLVGTEARAASEARLASLQLLGAHLLDVLRGLTDLRAFGRADHQRGQVDAAAANYRRETMQTLRAAFLSGLVLELVAMLGTALVAVIGGVRLAGGHATLAAILPALILAPELYAPLRRLGSGYHDAADARAALDRLAAVEALAAAAPVAGRPGGPAAPRPARRTIVLDRASVDGGDLAAAREARLRDVSLTIAAGETVALVGDSGAGKSTLASLLLGLLPPSDGRILVGPIGGGDPMLDLSTLDLATWRAGCAWVAQEPTLLPATLRENARLGAPEATDPAVIEALSDAGLASLLAALPDGLDTQLGDGGALLSSGELRRLALARALLAGAELLVLDEPTAQLDALTAERLGATIDRLRAGRTTVLITHDPALAERADRVVTLDGGRVANIEPGRGCRPSSTVLPPALQAVSSAGVRSALKGSSTAQAPLASQTSSLSVLPSPSAVDAPAALVSTRTPASPTRPTISLRDALRLVKPSRRDPVRRLVRRAVGLGALSALSGVAVLAISGGLIVEASTMPPVLELTSVIVLVRMFSILRATTRYGERLASHDAALRILQRVRVQVFTHLASGADSEARTDALDRAVGDVDRTADLLVRVVVPAVAAIVTAVLAVAITAILSPVAALVIAIAAVGGGLAVAVAGRRIGVRAARAEADRGTLAGEVVTALDASTELLLAGRTAQQQRRIAQRSETLEREAALNGARSAALSAVVSVLAAASAVAVAAVVSGDVAGGGLGGPFAAALVLAALATIERIDGLADASLATAPATGAVARLRTSIEHESADEVAPVRLDGRRGTASLPTSSRPRTGSTPAGSARGQEATPFTTAPALRAAGLTVRRGERRIVDGAWLELAPGERIALTGESGAGKSTLLLALAGLIPIDAGEVAASAGVLLVPSHPHLFGGSLAANL
ncbi:MAG: thiol reductant ABC exporter subunit CydD, partial [Solirubrobacteraceae bacterium]|nr:thiol reductant ABC exporter subunit CydD [Solirubrobacteraceae bacterium]